MKRAGAKKKGRGSTLLNQPKQITGSYSARLTRRRRAIDCIATHKARRSCHGVHTWAVTLLLSIGLNITSLCNLLLTNSFY